MTKAELEILFDSLGIKINEGIQNDTSLNIYPRIVYWEFIWEPMSASGKEYNTKVTYQVSFYSIIPRDPKLLMLKQKLNEKRLNPLIEHEYISEDKHFHSFLAIEVLENVG